MTILFIFSLTIEGLPPVNGEMRAWVYKVNSRRPGRLIHATAPKTGAAGTPVTGWHFDRFFRYRGQSPYGMGGEGWIRSPLSWAHLKRVRRGDLFLCYQSDERRIYGLARAAGAGYEDPRGRRLGRYAPGGRSSRTNSIDFAPRGLRLRNPLPVAAPGHRELFSHVRAFTVPSRGTIHPLAADELRPVLRAIVAANPAQRAAIRVFVEPR